MTLLTSQHVYNSVTGNDQLDITYAALNASTTKIVIGIHYIIYDDTAGPGLSSVTWDQGGNNESMVAVTNAQAIKTFSGDRHVITDCYYLDSPTLTAGTVRLQETANQTGTFSAYASIYEFDSEADTGFGGAVGTTTNNSADPSIAITTRDTDSVCSFVSCHQVTDANPFTAGGILTEDLDVDGAGGGAFFAGHGSGTGGSDTGSVTQTTARRNAATFVEVEQTVVGGIVVPVLAHHSYRQHRVGAR